MKYIKQTIRHVLIYVLFLLIAIAAASLFVLTAIEWLLFGKTDLLDSVTRPFEPDVKNIIRVSRKAVEIAELN